MRFIVSAKLASEVLDAGSEVHAVKFLRDTLWKVGFEPSLLVCRYIVRKLKNADVEVIDHSLGSKSVVVDI